MDALMTQDTDKYYYIERQLEIAKRDLSALKTMFAELTYAQRMIEDATNAIECAEAAHRS